MYLHVEGMRWWRGRRSEAAGRNEEEKGGKYLERKWDGEAECLRCVEEADGEEEGRQALKQMKEIARYE